MVISARILRKVAEKLSPGTLAYRLRRDGSLSLIDAGGRHRFFTPETVQKTAKAFSTYGKNRKAGGAKRGTSAAGRTTGNPVRDAKIAAGKTGGTVCFSCPVCGRVFRTKKGLEVHKAYCRR